MYKRESTPSICPNKGLVWMWRRDCLPENYLMDSYLKNTLWIPAWKLPDGFLPETIWWIPTWKLPDGFLLEKYLGNSCLKTTWWIFTWNYLVNSYQKIPGGFIPKKVCAFSDILGFSKDENPELVETQILN